jgi:hypothetical protein
MQEIKIVDGFIFAVINEETAKERFENNETVFKLYDDGTEAEVTHEEEFTNHNDDVFGVSIGFEKEFKEEFEEGAQNRFRNNDNRDFNQWLDDKINLILE